jgi:glycosyltransferase involved in cell wall biosynthesis
MSTVGVIVPVRGLAPWLDDALASVLDQSPAPDAVIVVDDGSSEPVRPSAGLADRVTLLRHESARGPAAARDTALAALDTELVALADSDDLWHEGKLAAQLEALGAEPSAQVCFGRAVIVDPAGEPTGEHWEEMAPGLHEPAELGPRLFEFSPIPASSAIIRRGALVDAGGFAGPAPLGSDWELWLRLVEAGAAFVYEPSAVVSYRRHAGGVTGDVAGIAEANLRIRELHSALAADEATRRRLRSRDLVGLARGRVRQRRYPEARRALAEAAADGALTPRERVMRALLSVPIARGALGRRDPYR